MAFVATEASRAPCACGEERSAASSARPQRYAPLGLSPRPRFGARAGLPPACGASCLERTNLFLLAASRAVRRGHLCL